MVISAARGFALGRVRIRVRGRVRIEVRNRVRVSGQCQGSGLGVRVRVARLCQVDVINRDLVARRYAAQRAHE